MERKRINKMREYEYYNLDDCIKRNEFGKYIRCIFKKNGYRLDRVTKSLRKEIYNKIDFAAYCAVKQYIRDKQNIDVKEKEVKNPF